MLHRFSFEPHPCFMHVDSFASFIDRLAAECELITLRELAVRLNTRCSSNRSLAVVTVDDGYADFHTAALPILIDRGVPATVFATAGFVDGQCWLWWDALRYLLDVQPNGRLRVVLAGQSFVFELSDQITRDFAWDKISDLLVTRNEARRFVLEQLEVSAGTSLPRTPPIKYAPMNWEQLQECETAGVEIGGHTMTHAFLPGLDQQELQHEIYDAKALLERYLTNPVTTFAYPNGMDYDWTPEVERVIRAADFQLAVLAYPRRFDPKDRYRLGRWSAGPDDPWFDHILSGASPMKLAFGGTSR
jgi:peptidoglycan/xylan/chitin deacetylase (PgdA/CDA1 family)